MFYFLRTVHAGLLALIRSGPRENIKLSGNFYFRVPVPEVRLISLGMEGIASFNLSIADTRKVFISIQAACDANERIEIVFQSTIGPAIWVTDCRVEKHGSEHMVITVKKDFDLSEAIGPPRRRFARGE